MSFLFFVPSLWSRLLTSLPRHSWLWPSFSLDPSLLIVFLLVLLFPKKTVFALDFNPINFYPWEDASHLILLIGLPLEVPRHSWRESLCGPHCKPSLEISSGDVHGRGVPCPLSSPRKQTHTRRPQLGRELGPLVDFLPSWCWRVSSSSSDVPETLGWEAFHLGW